jgi:pSer/pThr/pTyr-binding forkhead associated (FHA) protein
VTEEHFFIEEAPIEGLKRPATPGTTIGRAECEVELNDPDVSRRHALIRVVDGGLAVEDLGSTNGTFVNERRVTGIVELAAGDPGPLRQYRKAADPGAGIQPGWRRD